MSTCPQTDRYQIPVEYFGLCRKIHDTIIISRLAFYLCEETSKDVCVFQGLQLIILKGSEHACPATLPKWLTNVPVVPGSTNVRKLASTFQAQYGMWSVFKYFLFNA